MRRRGDVVVGDHDHRDVVEEREEDDVERGDGLVVDENEQRQQRHDLPAREDAVKSIGTPGQWSFLWMVVAEEEDAE